MKIIVGLGNPGLQYEVSRHNAGFIVIDLLADMLGLKFTKRKFKALISEGHLENEKVILAKPQTYMDLSGEAVGPLVQWYGTGGSNLIVIHDDLDLEVGRLRLRMQGGDGGHRGVRSVIQHLGTRDFLRVKIGIGRPLGGSTVDYVLRPFDDHQWETMRHVLPRAAEAVQALIVLDPEKAMNKYSS